MLELAPPDPAFAFAGGPAFAPPAGRFACVPSNQGGLAYYDLDALAASDAERAEASDAEAAPLRNARVLLLVRRRRRPPRLASPLSCPTTACVLRVACCVLQGLLPGKFETSKTRAAHHASWHIAAQRSRCGEAKAKPACSLSARRRGESATADSRPRHPRTLAQPP